jgi:uncharacterized surface protein with fasciclin (FAS1) repeats
MHLRRLASAVVGLGLTAALVAPAASATPRHHHSDPVGTRSLAAVLTSDGDRFDRNWNDYDIVTEAVLAVLANNPGSPVSVLTDGTVPLTAFIPNDRAFRLLVHDLTGTWPRSESQTFTAVAGLGIDTVETVLLYHVVPGATITSRMAARSNGASLTTALGSPIKVRVYNRWIPIIKLVDQDPDDANPFVNPRATDINKGNVQIAHGITRVLRPVNL